MGAGQGPYTILHFAPDENRNAGHYFFMAGNPSSEREGRSQKESGPTMSILLISPDPQIKYRETHTGSVKVYLDGQYVGTIVRNGIFWHYQPKGRGNPPGESRGSIAAIKLLLESEL